MISTMSATRRQSPQVASAVVQAAGIALAPSMDFIHTAERKESLERQIENIAGVCLVQKEFIDELLERIELLQEEHDVREESMLQNLRTAVSTAVDMGGMVNKTREVIWYPSIWAIIGMVWSYGWRYARNKLRKKTFFPICRLRQQLPRS